MFPKRKMKTEDTVTSSHYCSVTVPVRKTLDRVAGIVTLQSPGPNP